MPTRDSKRDKDGGGNDANGVFCQSRKAVSNNSHLLPHLTQVKYSNGGEVLHLKLFVQLYVAFLMPGVRNKKFVLVSKPVTNCKLIVGYKSCFMGKKKYKSRKSWQYVLQEGMHTRL